MFSLVREGSTFWRSYEGWSVCVYITHHMKLLQFRQILIFYVLNFLTSMSSIFRFMFVIVYIFLLSLLSCFNSFFFILFFFLSMTFHQTASILQYDHTLHIIISPMLHSYSSSSSDLFIFFMLLFSGCFKFKESICPLYLT